LVPGDVDGQRPLSSAGSPEVSRGAQVPSLPRTSAVLLTVYRGADVDQISLHRRKLNDMKCPNCSETLVMTDRNGIEIDYCPNCRGVWLDRGELDKIIERSSQYVPNAQQETYREKDYRGGDDYRYKKKKKESFLDDLFDFG
jgi:Zn-finger nucleic acid-binding protein